MYRLKNSYALLPAGNLSLKTGMCGHGWSAVEGDGDCSLILCEGPTGKVVLSTYGTLNKFVPGFVFASHHDQTRRQNPDLKVVEVFRNTVESLQLIRNMTGKSSLPFRVFK